VRTGNHQRVQILEELRNGIGIKIDVALSGMLLHADSADVLGMRKLFLNDLEGP
jgi:hypothetical protein